jgi:hypothetical protein
LFGLFSSLPRRLLISETPESNTSLKQTIPVDFPTQVIGYLERERKKEKLYDKCWVGTLKIHSYPAKNMFASIAAPP